MGTLLRLGLLAGIGGALYNHFRNKGQTGSGGNQGTLGTYPESGDSAPVHSSGFVRDAGPAAQRDTAGRDWDKVDQQSDESFPASDAPGTY